MSFIELNKGEETHRLPWVTNFASNTKTYTFNSSCQRIASLQKVSSIEFWGLKHFSKLFPFDMLLGDWYSGPNFFFKLVKGIVLRYEFIFLSKAQMFVKNIFKGKFKVI